MGNPNVVYLNYNILVYSDAGDNRLLHNNESLEKSRSVRKKIRYELGNELSQKLDSIGSTYLVPFEGSPSNKYYGGLFVGIASSGDDSLLQIPVGFRTITASNNHSQLWKQVKQKISEVQITINRNMTDSEITYITDTLSISARQPQNEPKSILASGESLPSYIPDEQNETNVIEEQIIKRGLGDPFGLSAEEIIGDKPTDLSSLSRPENLTDASVEQIKQSYDEQATNIRKPTEEEFKQIIDGIMDRMQKIADRDERVYLETMPDAWENATCARCQTNADPKHIHIKATAKAKEILYEQLQEGFGIAEASNKQRQFIHPDLTNFMIDDHGQVYFRPEEVLSWLVDISHYVESLCSACHNEYGGGGHEDHIAISVTADQQQQTLNNQSSNPELQISEQYDPLTIEATNNSTTNTQYYRPPTESEITYILDEIARYLYQLATRKDPTDTKMKNHREKLYNIVNKRKNITKSRTAEEMRCTTCNTIIGKKDVGFETLEQHHTDPQYLTEFKYDLMREHEDIDRASILVNDHDNDFILTDRFFWRIQTLINNIDTLTVLCDTCESKAKQNYTKETEQTEQQTLDLDNVDQKSTHPNHNISDTTVAQSVTPQIDDDTITFTCYQCFETFTAQRTKQGHYAVVNDNRYLCDTPILRTSNLNTEFVGACNTHVKSLIDNLDPDTDYKQQIVEQMRSAI